MHVLNQTPPYNLFGFEEQDYNAARIAVLPVPYDSTVSYRSGARNGPRAIIEASRGMELYSEELGIDVSKVGIYTLEELAPDFSSPESMVNRIKKEVDVILQDSKFPVLIGGEHTISLGAIKSIAGREKEFSVLQFDAHSDSRDEFMGAKVCHATVMARAREIAKGCFSVGVRSVDERSAGEHEKEILFMKDMGGMSAKEIAEAISKNTESSIYLTVDLDVLDPSEMPSVGTPEPDGMRFRELVDVVKELAKTKRFVGMDFTELSPIPGLIAPDYLAAKLIYLAIGSIFIKNARV